MCQLSESIQADCLRDECGVFAACDLSGQREDAARLVYLGLFALQHRGQDSAGIAVNNHGTIICQRSKGLVVEGFNEVSLHVLQGHAAIGHVRYPGQGETGLENAQPMRIKYRAGQLTLAFNGAVYNAGELRQGLVEAGAIFQTASDAEIMLALLARNRILTDHLEQASQRLAADLRGAYSLVMMTAGKVIGMRDPLGIRPLCLGRLDDTWFLASESCAIDAAGGEFVRDVRPGEIITLSQTGVHSLQSAAEPRTNRICLFEYVYFARPDSTIEGTNVFAARVRAGQRLAEEQPSTADLVIGAPDSGLAASIGFAHASGIRHGQGLLKNRYVGRTFIQPNQMQRELTVKLKFSALKEAVAGLRVVLVDDSIVRGTTTRHVVSLLKKAGAREVHMRIASPPILYPCFYGIDTPDQQELTAVAMSLEEMRQLIGADSLGFLSLSGLRQAVGGNGHCSSCFDGEFPAGLPASQANRIKRVDLDQFLNNDRQGGYNDV